MKLGRAYRYFRAFQGGISKKRYVVILPITKSGRMQKSSKKKKERKIFYGTFSLAVFLFPMIKRKEEVSGFVYLRKDRGKK